MNNNAILTSAAEALLFKEDFKADYDAVHQLHDLFAGITHIDAGNIVDQDVYLSSGKAISPTKAAHCLLELTRTKKFVRGIYKAILHLKDIYPGTTINILYAGTGPYATLLTPLTAVFSSEEVSYYFLDINEISLAAVKQLYAELGLQAYVKQYIEADATTYQICYEDNIHMAISETMQNALKREPQVAIMNNLIPQLPDNGIFIPEEIIVEAALLNLGEETKAPMEGRQPERNNLGTIFKVGRHINSNYEAVNLTLPVYNPKNHVHLMTTIKVYQDEVLNTNECSLTIPYRVPKLDISAADEIAFRYILDENPRFEYALSPVMA